MNCRATRTLIDITTQCLNCLINSDTEACINALLGKENLFVDILNCLLNQIFFLFYIILPSSGVLNALLKQAFDLYKYVFTWPIPFIE